MAKHSDFPASAPPIAPERESTARMALRAHIIILLLAAFGHTAVFNLVGMAGSAVVLGVITVVTLSIWIPAISRAQPWPLEWRRLPWAIFVYVLFALASVLWSQWPSVSLLTCVTLVTFTLHAIFIAHMLSWREMLAAIASALKWLLGLSIALELWVALVLRHPLLPNFFDAPSAQIDPHWYWVRGNFLDGGRIQGVVGNSNALAALCLLAMIVFGVLVAARARWRITTALWIAVAAYLAYRAGSATVAVAAVAVAITLAVALLMRRAQDPRSRTRIYAVALGGSAALAALAVVFRDQLLGSLGRTGDLTGRLEIWERVLERAWTHPWFGNGYASPWVPTDPAFDGWIVDHGISVLEAHNMWVDVFLQLGFVGLALVAFIFASLLWRSWFFAVDRPRWDLRADREFSPLTLAPSLIAMALVVQGLTESRPILLWGWLLVVLLSYKIKAVPLLGVGLSERARVIDRGEQRRRVP